MLGISSCLGGICCRYDGKSQEISLLKQLVENEQAYMICPEVLGGLPIPREPAEIQWGDGVDVWQGIASVVTQSGQDVTEEFKKGAKEAYKNLKKLGITTLILKENSPSCGAGNIYDGNFSGIKKEGIGVATAYFRSKGLEVVSDVEWLCANE